MYNRYLSFKTSRNEHDLMIKYVRYVENYWKEDNQYKEAEMLICEPVLPRR